MIVVAGASAGIGLEIARCLSTNGEMVCGIARRPLSEIPGGAELFTRYIQMDLTSQSVNERLDVELADFSTEISGWVNNIGKSGWRKIEEIDLNFIEDLMKTNLYPYVLMSKSAIKMSGLRSIVNVSSIAGRRGTKNNIIYSASKFGITALTQSLAKELGERGIRVNSVSPVLIETPGLIEALEDSNSPKGNSSIQEFFETFAKNQSALGRLPTAGEVAETVLWLLSNRSSAITGQNINVDCGVFPQ